MMTTMYTQGSVDKDNDNNDDVHARARWRSAVSVDDDTDTQTDGIFGGIIVTSPSTLTLVVNPHYLRHYCQ